MDLQTPFDENAENYDSFRPTYPTELIKKLINDTGFNAKSSLLEIGPGTGQATIALAHTAADITAIELGRYLADKARQTLRPYNNIRIITNSFEDVDLPASTYDLIYAATAFHWVKNEYKFTKTAQLLKPDGYLAIIHTEHVSDNTGDVFQKASQPIYDTYWPPKANKGPHRLPSLSDLETPFIDTTFFRLQSYSVFPRVKTYSAHDYAGLLSTYSPTIALPPVKRQNFLTDIEKLINEQFGNKLAKHFAFTLTIARKK